MKVTKQHLVFFSATGNTRNVVRNIAKQTGLVSQEYNITKEIEEDSISLSDSDLLIIAVPSYAGRVPAVCIPSINKFKGKNTPVVLVCTYGNRDYEDTLLELKDIVVSNGFKVVSAGAFVASHSIFPQVAADRPNKEDEIELTNFAQHSIQLLEALENHIALSNMQDIHLRGNYPYRKASRIPLKPKGDKTCDACGVCVHLCPTGAISKDNPRKTDTNKCISCARCIAICPQHSRAFGGLLYKIASNRFVKKHAAPQHNIVSYIE